MSKLNNLIFTFEYALLDHALNELKKLHPNKSSPLNDILVQINQRKERHRSFIHTS